MRRVESESDGPVPLSSTADVLALLTHSVEQRLELLDRIAAWPAERREQAVRWLAELAQDEEQSLAWIRSRPAPPTESVVGVPSEWTAVRIALDEAHAAAIAFLKYSAGDVLLDECGWPSGRTTVGGVYHHIIERDVVVRAQIEMLAPSETRP